MKALIGIRCSTADQLDKYGPEVQLEACLLAAARQGYDVELDGLACDMATRQLTSAAGVVLDHQSVTKYSASGEVDLEARFYHQVFARLGEGGFDAYVTYDMTRVTRSGLMQQLLLEAEIKKHVPRVLYATLQLEATDEAEMIKNVLASIGHWQIGLTRARLTEARRAKSASGVYAGGRVAYGYGLDGSRHYVIQEPEASVVRQIYAWYTFDGRDLADPALRGQSSYWIANELNRRGVPGPLHRVGWSEGRITLILRNEKYAGVGRYADRTFTLPAIVDRETWDRAQQRAQQQRSHAERSNVRTQRFLCHRRVRCAYCRYAASLAYTHNNPDRAWYQCFARVRPLAARRACPVGPRVSAQWLDEQVRQALAQIAAGHGLDYALRGYLEVWQREWQEAELQLPQLEAAVADVAAEIERATLNFTKGRWTEARADQYIAEASARRRDVQVQVDAHHAALARRDRFHALLARWGIADPNDVAIVELASGAGESISGEDLAAQLETRAAAPSLDFASARQLLQDYDVEVTLWEDRIELQGSVPLPQIPLPEAGNAVRSSSWRTDDGIPFAVALRIA